MQSQQKITRINSARRCVLSHSVVNKAGRSLW